MTTKLTKDQLKIVVTNKEQYKREIKDYDVTTFHLDAPPVEKGKPRFCAFETPRKEEIQTGDTIKIDYKGKLEFEGYIVKIIKSSKKLKVIASTEKVDLPDVGWGFEFVNNWGVGSFTVLAFVFSRKTRTYGVLLFNFGIYLVRKAKKKKEK